MAEDLIRSFFKFQEEEGGLTGLRGVVVKQFAESLIEAGVSIPSPPPWIEENSNARILKKEAKSVGVLMHEYTPADYKGPPVWGILKSQVDLMRKEYSSNWGVVLLRGEQSFEFGFWVDGAHFDRLAEGPHSMKDKNRQVMKDKNGQVIESYRIHQRNLEETSYAQRFGTVDEFLNYVDL